MLEETVDVFINRIKDIVITDQNMTSIPLAYMMTRDLPDAIKHFFDQEVEIWIREEEEKFTTTERFDYDVPEVRMLIDQIFDHLKQNATFHTTKFYQLLERAVKLEMNYLVEPHRTLSQFIFKDKNIVSTMEIYDTLKYFFRLEYYKTAISDYFNLKYLREISKEQFEELIAQIDEKAFSESRAETTLKMIKSIMSFLADAQNTQVDTLPYDVLKSAFRDRNLDDYLDLLNKAKENQDISELTFEQLETMLRDGILPGEVSEVKDKTEIIGIEKHEDIETSRPEVAVEEIDVQVPIEETVVADEDIDEDIEDEEFELEEETEDEVVTLLEPEVAEEETAEEEITEAEIAPETSRATGQVAMDLADHVARQISSDRPLEDLNNLIKGRVRRRVVKKLFNRKEHEYLNFLEKLNELVTWKDASRLIDDEFYAREINPYSKEAIMFSDIIYVRFFPKDKYVHTDEEDRKF